MEYVGIIPGVHPQMYARSQVAPYPTEFLALEDVPQNSVSLRQVDVKSCLIGGQGFVRCHCTQIWQTNRSVCKKKKCVVQF